MGTVSTTGIKSCSFPLVCLSLGCSNGYVEWLDFSTNVTNPLFSALKCDVNYNNNDDNAWWWWHTHFNSIKPSNSTHSLGVDIDDWLTFDKHINAIYFMLFSHEDFWAHLTMFNPFATVDEYMSQYFQFSTVYYDSLVAKGLKNDFDLCDINQMDFKGT